MKADRTWNFTLILCVLMTFACTFVQAQGNVPPSKQGLADMLLEYVHIRYPGTDLSRDVIYVSAQRQRLFHLRGGHVVGDYPISTSAAGLGSEWDSFRTPQGLHYVREKIGEGCRPWSILRWRTVTSEVADSSGNAGDDVITSRILRLAGMEGGVNAGGEVDSFERSIYIHGTADERSLGRPGSHGCVRMRNRDVIELFSQVPVGSLVVILDN